MKLFFLLLGYGMLLTVFMLSGGEITFNKIIMYSLVGITFGFSNYIICNRMKKKKEKNKSTTKNEGGVLK